MDVDVGGKGTANHIHIEQIVHRGRSHDNAVFFSCSVAPTVCLSAAS
jgi:hypothetical protein